MQALEELYLSENEIKDISKLRDLPKLKKLDLNTNKLETFKDMLPDLPLLEHLDVSANVIVGGSENLLALSKYSNLKNFVAAGNPFADELGDKLKGELLF